jgi:hypothetical protein
VAPESRLSSGTPGSLKTVQRTVLDIRRFRRMVLRYAQDENASSAALRAFSHSGFRALNIAQRHTNRY